MKLYVKEIDFVGVGLLILIMTLFALLLFNVCFGGLYYKNSKIVDVYKFANNLSEVQNFKAGLDSWSIQYTFYTAKQALEKQERYPVIYNCSRLDCSRGLHKVLYYSKDGRGLLVVIQPDFKDYISFSWMGVQIDV